MSDRDPIVDIVLEYGMSLILGDTLCHIEYGVEVDFYKDMVERYALTMTDRKTGETKVTYLDIDADVRDFMGLLAPADEWRQFYISPLVWQKSYLD